MTEETRLMASIGQMGTNIIALLSSGFDEEIETIENHISNHDLVNFIFEKYKDKLPFPKSDDFKELEEYFCSLDGVVQGNASRKFAVHNDSGLLFVLSILFIKGIYK